MQRYRNVLCLYLFCIGWSVFPWNLFRRIGNKKCDDKQESGTCHHSLVHTIIRRRKKRTECKLKITNQNSSWWVIVCFVCVPHAEQRHLFGICVYDNVIVIYWLDVMMATNIIGSHHISCECKVFYILMVAKSDNTIRQHAMLLLVISIKTHSHTHTRSVIRLYNGNGLVQLKRNRMQCTLVTWVYCIRYKCLEMKWNVSSATAEQAIVFYFRKYGLLLGCCGRRMTFTVVRLAIRVFRFFGAHDIKYEIQSNGRHFLAMCNGHVPKIVGSLFSSINILPNNTESTLMHLKMSCAFWELVPIYMLIAYSRNGFIFIPFKCSRVSFRL